MRSKSVPDSKWLCDDVPTISGRRGAPRLRLSIPARLVTLTDTRRCILINLSRTGAQVGLQVPLRRGEGAVLNIADLDQFGMIVRHEVGPNGGVNGIHFEDPLTDDDVLAVRSFSESFQAEAHRSLRREVRAWVRGID